LALAPYDPSITQVMTGTLMYEGGCLLFRDEESGQVVLPTWPLGSSFNGTAVIMHVPGKADQPVVVSEEIELSGRPLAQPLPMLADFERQCAVPFVTVAEVRPAN
jgi:hypothetical protein